VDANIRSIEESMFDENNKQTIQAISLVRRDIIALRRIIRPQAEIVRNLEQIDRPYIKEELDVYFGDILDHLQKARDIIEDDAEVIAGLADTIDALAAYRINEVIRVLTVVSFVLLPLEVIVGFMGMNVVLPLTNNVYAYLIILGVMAVIAAAMFVFFKKKHWL
jgi:magnesium transporter